MEKINSNQEILPLHLFSPPASQNKSSIAILWDKPEKSSDIVGYQIYVNSEIHGSSQSTDYTVDNLESLQEYEIYIRSILTNGELSLESNKVKVTTKPVGETFDITSFGAVGDGKTLNTEAIQKAIDECTHGGTVYVPKGVFLTGAIFLKSNMTLFIDEGGVLLGSSDTADYPLFEYRWEGLETICYASLINTGVSNKERSENITIEGPGKIDANGSALRRKEITEKKGKPGRAVCIRNVDYLYLKDITIKQSPAWCVHLIYCSHVSVNNVKIYSKHDEDGKKYMDIVNGDGLNPDSSSHIYIFHSMIASQDDCIAIKSGRDAEGRKVGIPTENVRITNCQFKSGFGVAVGSEMSGSVRNVLVQDCDFQDVYSVGSIKAPRGRGGIVENIKYEDITFKNYDLSHEDCEWFRGAIYIDQFYSHREFDPDKAEEVDEGTSILRDISFKNITLETLTGNAIYLTGLPESPLKSIRLENINAVGKYGFKANNIRGLMLNNVTLESREDDKFVFNNVE
ncbi:glycosyl hydrolase family 28 protein [Neobacillus sp. Marseille-QA0830]